MNSVLTKEQKIHFVTTYKGDWAPYITLKATVRYDDQCGNGHNTFSITGSEFKSDKMGNKISSEGESGGCIHDEIAKHFPELAPLIKWHLVSSDGPMHYIANTLYWAKLAHEGGDKSPYNYSKELKTREGCLDAARNTAVGADLPDEFFAVDEGEQEIYPGVMVPLNTFNRLKQALEDRLPQLLEDFKKDVESLGLTF